MYPASSVCGLYFAHPESRYFGLGAINNDQVIDLNIYDINGRKIHSLLRNAEMEIGQHQIRWNAREFGSGLYFVQLKNNENVLIKKIMLLK